MSVWCRFFRYSQRPAWHSCFWRVVLLIGSEVDGWRVYLLPLVLGYILFGLAPTPLWGAAGIVLLGMGAGLHAMMMGTFWAEAFGTRHLGAIRAMTAAFMVLGTALGPVMTGALIDLGVDFPTQTFGIAAYFAGASVLAGVAGRKVSSALAPAGTSRAHG